MGISERLPKTGYIKMIDIWTIFSISYPFFVIALYSTLEVHMCILRRKKVLIPNLDIEGKTKLSILQFCERFFINTQLPQNKPLHYFSVTKKQINGERPGPDEVNSWFGGRH